MSQKKPTQSTSGGTIKMANAGMKAIPPEARRTIFLKAYEELAKTYSPQDLGLLCGLGHSQTRSDLDRKLRDPSMASARGVSQADALLWQLMLLLHRDGYDLAGFRFDENGYLDQIKRRPVSH